MSVTSQFGRRLPAVLLAEYRVESHKGRVWPDGVLSDAVGLAETNITVTSRGTVSTGATICE